MAHRGFDKQMQVLEDLAGRDLDAAGIDVVRKALADRNNFIVSKAARLAEDNNLTVLLPEMIRAFDRFFDHAEKTDPQCWAKNALSRALPKLECRDKEVFLRGLHHHQWEPTWGGRSDTAGTLRGNCAHALVGCEGLSSNDLLLLLLDLLADADKSVRVEAVRAMAQLGDPAIPVLRLRALIPGEDAEVLAVCFQGLLAIERDAGVGFVARFLQNGDNSAAEAAFALAETHQPDALEALLQLRQNPPAESPQPWFAAVLLSAIALTRLPKAIDYLLGLIEREDREAPAAIEALAKLSPGAELRARVAETVREIGSPRLAKALEEHFGPGPAEGLPPRVR